VLVRTQTSSDATAGVTGMFISPFEGPYMIIKVMSPSAVEVCDSNGEIKDRVNWKSIKVSKEANDKI
jgi:hypothetical protein